MESVNTSFHPDLHPNLTVSMTRLSFTSKMINVVYGTEWGYEPKKWPKTAQAQAQLWTKNQARSPKAHFWLNLAEAYERCVCRAYDAYVPNLRRMHLLDKKPKITQFPFLWDSRAAILINLLPKHPIKPQTLISLINTLTFIIQRVRKFYPTEIL